MYGNETFRYRYAEVTGILTERLKRSPDKELDELVPEPLEAFSTLLSSLRDKAGERRLDKAYKALGKLGDHVALEVQRMRYLTSQNERNERRASELSRSLSEAEGRIREASSSARSMQKEYIAILGIFAGAVLAANGGLSLATSAPQAAVGMRPSQLLALVALIGLVLFDVLLAMFTFIGKIVGQGDGRSLELMSGHEVVLLNAASLLFCLLVSFAK